MLALCRAIEVVIEALCAAMVVAFATIILVDVICRYWLKIPIPWVSECTVFLFQCTAFLGATLALRKGLHFGLGPVVTRMWPRLAGPIGVFVAVLVTASSLLLGILAIELAEQTWEAIYATLQISHAWIYIVITFSAAVMALFGLEHAYRLITQPNLDEEGEP